jgi:hypothetical protein
MSGVVMGAARRRACRQSCRQAGTEHQRTGGDRRHESVGNHGCSFLEKYIGAHDALTQSRHTPPRILSKTWVMFGVFRVLGPDDVPIRVKRMSASSEPPRHADSALAGILAELRNREPLPRRPDPDADYETMMAPARSWGYSSLRDRS